MPEVHVNLPMDSINSICGRHQIRELAVFGAALRDDFCPESPVDFLVEFEGEAGIDLPELLGIQDEFAAAVGHKVNLVPKAGLRLTVRDKAMSQAVVVFRA